MNDNKTGSADIDEAQKVSHRILQTLISSGIIPEYFGHIINTIGII